jgi:hypothetical protein
MYRGADPRGSILRRSTGVSCRKSAPTGLVRTGDPLVRPLSRPGCCRWCIRGTVVDPQQPCDSDFRLSITKALGDQLGEAVRLLTPAPLRTSELDRLKREPGVYQLYRNGTVVYTGKADQSIPSRLGNHLRKISGRQGISLDEMSFICLYLAEDLSALAPETLLIKQFTESGYSSWNRNGFGNKDPGQRRETTLVKSNHFDAQFQINLDFVISLEGGDRELRKLLNEVKAALPFNFRYAQTLKRVNPVSRRVVNLEGGDYSAREIFECLLAHLSSEDWQVTALPGYAILYPEAVPDIYRSAIYWWRWAANGSIHRTVGSPQFAEAGKIDDDDYDDSELLYAVDWTFRLT